MQKGWDTCPTVTFQRVPVCTVLVFVFLNIIQVAPLSKKKHGSGPRGATFPTSRLHEPSLPPLSLLLPRHSRFFPRSCLRRHHPPPSPLHHSSPSHLLAPSYNGEAGQAARLSSAPAGRADVLVTLPAMAPHGHPPSLPGALPACASSAPFLPTARSPAMAARPSPLPAPSLSPSPVAGHDRTAHGEAGALLPPNAAVARAGHCSRRRAPDRLGCRLILRFYGIPVCTSKDFNEVSLQVHVSVTFMN